MKKNIKKKKGFTLIELIIVVAVLGILALIAVPKFGEIQKNSKKKADIASGKIIADTATRIVVEGDKTYTADTKTEIKTSDNVGGELQDIPKVQYNNVGGSKKFYYEVDSNGNVAVYVSAGGNGATYEEIYPTQGGGYAAE